MASSIVSTSLCSINLLPSKPTSRRIGPHHQSKRSTISAALGRNDAHDPNPYRYYGGRSVVDENLIVLRKRIHEMKMLERNYEPPSHWMAWEKDCYAAYDEFVCDAVGLLQSMLMNTRPSLALGAAALVALAVPASAAVVLFRFAEVAHGALAGVHLVN